MLDEPERRAGHFAARHLVVVVLVARALQLTGSPVSTTGSTNTTTTSQPGTTTTSTLPSNYCEVADLRGAVEGTAGAAGTIEMTFSFTNTSPSTCVLYGYPGALLRGPGGAR